MPKINPTQKYPNQLINGHTHLFMLCGKMLPWGSEAKLKYMLAKTLAMGDRETLRIQKGGGVPKHANTDPPCKIVYIVMGDSSPVEWIDDVRLVQLMSNLGRGQPAPGHICQGVSDLRCIHSPHERKD